VIKKFDFVYWTGDLPPHNVWNQTRNDQLNAIKVLTTLFKKYFPNKAIFPTLGNHETTPVNLLVHVFNLKTNHNNKSKHLPKLIS
jgi:hypothetical protein